MLGKKVLARIETLGGDISQVKGASLREDLSAITFNTPLYQWDDAFDDWSLGEDDEPIYGLNDFIEAHRELYKEDKDEFRRQLVAHFYSPQNESVGAQWIGQPFTPFQEGTADYQQWYLHFSNEEFVDLYQITKLTKELHPNFIHLLASEGYPDGYYIAINDPNPENPTVFSTDHEAFFSEINKEGKLEKFLNNFITPQQLITILDKELK